MLNLDWSSHFEHMSNLFETHDTLRGSNLGATPNHIPLQNKCPNTKKSNRIRVVHLYTMNDVDWSYHSLCSGWKPRNKRWPFLDPSLQTNALGPFRINPQKGSRINVSNLWETRSCTIQHETMIKLCLQGHAALAFSPPQILQNLARTTLNPPPPSLKFVPVIGEIFGLHRLRC